jgi:hypothetical protein
MVVSLICYVWHFNLNQNCNETKHFTFILISDLDSVVQPGSSGGKEA